MPHIFILLNKKSQKFSEITKNPNRDDYIQVSEAFSIDFKLCRFVKVRL